MIRGPFKGKKIEFAPAARVEQFHCLADEFMLEIFDFLPGEYLITDESSIPDFTELGSSDTLEIWSRIAETYAVERNEVPSERLVDIFAEIQGRRSPQ